ncbi:MAG: transposase [Candidatus Cloacimonadota bacterium]|nr:transposase [Candidatus Cloacimonadota bacterium]
MVMALGQLGSLNALEQNKDQSYWRKWIKDNLPSADAIGDGFKEIVCDDIREIIKHVYSRMKRNKALKPAYGSTSFALILDGHENHSSYLRECGGCLERVIHKSSGDVKQSYHRLVMVSLLCEGITLPLDMESQRPREGEVACAMRLLKRVLKNYPRAFDLILADGLYAQAPFLKLALKHGKEVIAVLKDKRRDVLKDANGLFKGVKPEFFQNGNTKIECWDMENFTSWPQVGHPVRVVSTVERKSVRRQKTKKIHWEASKWAWVTTIPKKRLGTKTFLKFAHGRWKIENEGFNELVNYWHANHVYCHHPVAIEGFWLITMLAYILFHAFIGRNLKPQIRDKHTKKYLAMMVTAELYSTESFAPS